MIYTASDVVEAIDTLFQDCIVEAPVVNTQSNNGSGSGSDSDPAMA